MNHLLPRSLSFLPSCPILASVAAVLLAALPLNGLAQGIGDGPRENPYADMPLIKAAEAADFNSFAQTGGLAAPEIAMSGLPGAPVVVELFTSQGCSSCPPADAMLGELVDEPGVLPLSFHVDYWDYLGWADEFAQPEFTERQQNYALSAGERTVYTPQMIVGGQDTAPSLRPAELMAMIDAHRASPATISVQETEQGDKTLIELTPLSDLGGPVAVSLVRFAPSRTVEVKGGENRGRLIVYHNVVLDLQQLAEWNGHETLRLMIGTGDSADATGGEEFPEDTRHAILIQRVSGAKAQMPGPMLTALQLD